MLPRDIGNLFHLRYLNINKSYIESVPSSIGNLRFLQTLDLRTYTYLEIPNVLWRLEQLRHLCLPRRIKLTGTGKLRLHGLSKLETLEAFDTEYCDVRYFPKLTNLRKVEVRSKDPKDLAVILKPLILNNSNGLLLPSLSFWISGDFETEEEQSILRQLLGCHHLCKLELLGSLNLVNKLPDQFPPLEEDPMPTLEKFPNLRILILSLDSYIGKEMVCSFAPPPTTTTKTIQKKWRRRRRLWWRFSETRVFIASLYCKLGGVEGGTRSHAMSLPFKNCRMPKIEGDSGRIEFHYHPP
ncbi:putative disease resistance protein RDL6 [Camellia lanceoleosa]|uniref:Disease resistance protein RDL6 n=1 Tax=Camellia lanceoleosa TaxID=1840588 RepID=A0ACC0IKW8_9ERIC|nr:putative disease resistance protein RDL6 [Camellia lanceoleosa]